MSPKKSLSKKSPAAVEPLALPLVAGQDLRRQAEAQLSERKKKTAHLPAPQADTQRLIHELQVHQIELEMQNEELVQARAEAEAALRQYADLYDFAPVGYFTLARDGAISRVNLAGARLLGLERRQLLKRRLGLFLSAEFRIAFNAFLDKVFTSGKNEACEIEILKNGSAPLWVHIEAGTDRGEHEICRAVMVDISERKQAEEQVRAITERLKFATASAKAGVWDWNLQTNEMIWDDRMHELYGLTHENFPGGVEAWKQGLHPDDASQAIQECEAALAGGPDFDTEFRVLRPDGTVVYLKGNGLVLRDEQSKLLRMIGLNVDISARKQAEEALRVSEERYRLLANNVPDIIYSLDGEGNIVTINSSAFERYGYAAAEALGKPFLDFILPEDRETVINSFLQAVETQRTLTQGLQFRIVAANGFSYWVELNSQARFDAQGRYAGEDGILRDISERKQAEEALRESEDRFHLMFEKHDAIMLLIEPQTGLILDANHAATKFYGYEKSELCVMSINAINTLPPEQVADERRKALHDERNYFVFPHRLANGTERIVEVHSSPISFKEKQILFSVIHDITERKQMEDALRKSENEFRMLAESMPQMVWVCQPDGKNIYFNRHWVDYTGLTLDESYGDGWNQPFHPDDQPRAWDAWQNATKNLAEYSLECRLRRADGAYTWWLIRGVPLVDAEGRVLKWFGTCTDIDKLMQAESEIRQLNATLEARVTERTRELHAAQEQLVIQEKLAVLGQLASGVAEKLRNPLTVISNTVYYLSLVQPERNEEITEYHGLIEAEVHEAQKIVTDLLDFANFPTPDPEPIAIPELVQRVMERHPQPPLIKVALNLPADLPKVYADLLQMEQVLGNLILNANQAMPAGGQLEISAQLTVINTADPAVALTVKDNGTGISPENMQKLFTPLFTTKAKSLGLGLALSQKLVEANGGKIEVASKPDQGSTFTVFLPVYDK